MGWPRRFKGMIRPNMALDTQSANKVMRRKSIFMVAYLRARRDPNRYGIAVHRRLHLAAMAKLRTLEGK